MNQSGDNQRQFERRSVLTVDQVDEIKDRIRDQLQQHAKQEMEVIERRFAELKDLLSSAFPNEDPIKHRQYHEEVIDYMRERRELWKSIRDKSLSGLVWALLAAVGTAVWQYLKVKIGAP